MPGTDETIGSLFGYSELEERIPARCPLRNIRHFINNALAILEGELASLYANFGDPASHPNALSGLA